MKILLKVLKWIGIIISTLLLTLIAVGGIYFSLDTHLPKPTGKYEVGVTYRRVQTTRNINYNNFADSNRVIYLKIWYPAQVNTDSKKVRTPFIEGGATTGEQFFEDPQLWHSIAINQAVKVKTNSFVDLPIIDGKFPIVTYSHGYSQWSSDNTTLMESLASKGFVVVSISHTPQVLYAPISHDAVIISEVITLSDIQTDTAEYRRHREKYTTLQTQEELNAYHLYGRKFSSGLSADLWSDDIVTAIQYMKQTQHISTDFFFQKLDTTKVGSVGFSMGGSAAVNATLKDSSICAAINMDGGLAGDFLHQRPDADILFLTGLRRLPASNVTISHFGNFKDKNNQHYPTLMIEGAMHANFTDLNSISILLKWMGILGQVDSQFMIEQKNLIIHDFLTASFHQKPFDANQYEIKDKVINFDY